MNVIKLTDLNWVWLLLTFPSFESAKVQPLQEIRGLKHIQFPVHSYREILLAMGYKSFE